MAWKEYFRKGKSSMEYWDKICDSMNNYSVREIIFKGGFKRN